jgi:20S proteasome subunit alpha 6
MQAILEQWCQASAVGPVRDRRRFIKEHLKDVSNLIEILLRLTRGERAIPVGGSPASLHGPLASALNHESVYASHQTHVSLAVLAMYRLTTEYAEKAGEKIATVDDKVVDIIKSLPTSLVNRSLDGLFKEWTGGVSAK